MYLAQKYYMPSEYVMKTPYKAQSADEQGSIPMIDFVLLLPQSKEVKIKIEKLAKIAPILSF